MKLTKAQHRVLNALATWSNTRLVPFGRQWRMETPDAGWGIVRADTIFALWKRDLLRHEPGDVYTITPAGLSALREGRDAD